jgi:hypothetical protein
MCDNRSRNIAQCCQKGNISVEFKININSFCNFQFGGDKYCTTGVRHLKFGAEIDCKHNRTYTLYTNRYG